MWQRAAYIEVYAVTFTLSHIAHFGLLGPGTYSGGSDSRRGWT
jgi:hypothetical protein